MVDLDLAKQVIDQEEGNYGIIVSYIDEMFSFYIFFQMGLRITRQVERLLHLLFYSLV